MKYWAPENSMRQRDPTPATVRGRIPANRHDFPGFPGQLDPMRTLRQEWQIVQSKFDLCDLLP